MSEQVAASNHRAEPPEDNDPNERQGSYVVVKFNADDPRVGILYDLLIETPDRTLEELLHRSENRLPDLLNWGQLDQSLRISAVFTPANRDVIQERRREGGRLEKIFDERTDKPSLQQYVRFDADESTDEARRRLGSLAELIRNDDLHPVKLVYVGTAVGNPPQTTTMLQGVFLDPDVGGIGIKSIQGRYNGADGKNTWFVDVEQGWTLPHPELGGNVVTTLVSGVNRDWVKPSPDAPYAPVGWHGLMILGLVVARKDDGSGLTGIAPASRAFLSSEWKKLPHTPYMPNTAQAIKDAADLLDPGDVILIEGQKPYEGWGNLPVEADPIIFEAIRYATEQDITVIEPAGNNSPNGVDLDSFMADANPPHPLGLRLFEHDSGAILVGAGNNNPPPNPDVDKLTFTRRDQSNHGKKVRCFADGDMIWSLDPLNAAGDSLDNYFRVPGGGTSSAAAIIAGVALVLQGIQRTEGKVISAKKMRELLSNKNRGTKPLPNGTENRIGVMPNLIEMETANGGKLTGLGNLPI